MVVATRGYLAIVFASAFILARGSATQAPSWVWEPHHPAAAATALPRFRRNSDAADGSCIQDAYIGNQCCAGACGTSYFACFECLSTPEQDPYSYGGPSCFVEGSCIAQASERVCAPPARLQFDVNDGTPYAGWCLCPKGSFCHGDGCNSNTTAEAGPPPRDRWHTDTVSEGAESMPVRELSRCHSVHIHPKINVHRSIMGHSFLTILLLNPFTPPFPRRTVPGLPLLSVAAFPLPATCNGSRQQR